MSFRSLKAPLSELLTADRVLIDRNLFTLTAVENPVSGILCRFLILSKYRSFRSLKASLSESMTTEQDGDNLYLFLFVVFIIFAAIFHTEQKI